jgi:hypothetical protein
MITLIKEDLLDSDFSMCLGLLMSYKEPEDILTVIRRAEKIRDSIIKGKEYQMVKPKMAQPSYSN